ncbi:hypothetical protein TSUD_292030 [Trifolium subterraneum]|uniref:Uncharacterized protein n=1 Tax=Trifolium subterraneum TaxID=3900 RepID=A0A2Z6P6J9_TRISU|nr:hypothetical protein TSUD_292030 [Trifolium subterraneum]
MGQREAIKSQLSVPNSPCVNPPRNHLPSHFKTTQLLDIPRIWAEFWIHNVEPCSNTSEIPLEVALALQTILAGNDIIWGKFSVMIWMDWCIRTPQKEILVSVICA